MPRPSQDAPRSQVKQHERQPPPLELELGATTILKWTILHRILAFFILQLSGQLIPHFDSSASLLLLSSPLSRWRPWLSPLIRWDTLHFLGAASPEQLPPSPKQAGLDRLHDAAVSATGGYAFEHSLAFQAGLPMMMRVAGSIGASKWSADQAVIVTTVLAWICSILSPPLLYSITLKHFRHKKFAYLSALLSILSPAPSTLLSPTPEPFFSFTTLLGLWLLAPADHHEGKLWSRCTHTLLAAICFAASSALRANGVLLAGFLLWAGFWEARPAHWGTFTQLISAMTTLAGTAITFAPFLAGQVWAYERFCLASAAESRPWCGAALPAVYSFVQREYWNVGLFRYWEMAQIPNFLLAAPVLALIGLSYRYAFGSIAEIATTILMPWQQRRSLPARADSMATESSNLSALFHYTRAPSVLPHVLYLWINGLLLLFASHVQIALRFASPGGMPALWWVATAVVCSSSSKKMGKEQESVMTRSGVLLVGYLVLWNFASLVLYAGFYPPA